jgi:hypothetical protein
MSLSLTLINAILEEFKRQGINADARLENGYLTISLKADEIKNIIISRVPIEFKNSVEVQAGDIVVKLKVV